MLSSHNFIFIKKFKIVVCLCCGSTWFFENEKNSLHFPPDTVTIVLYQKNGKLDKTDFVSSIKKQSKIFDVKKIEKVTKQRI